METERRIVGKLDQDVIDRLKLDVKPGTPIYISETNIGHIRERHADAYIRYMDSLEDIILKPDYIGIAGVHAPSIEFVKRFRINNELVNVAVRATRGGVHYVRSMFIIGDGKLNDYLKKNKLINLTN